MLCSIPKAKCHHILTSREFPVKQPLLATLQYLDLSMQTVTDPSWVILRSQIHVSLRCLAKPAPRPQFPAVIQFILVVKYVPESSASPNLSLYPKVSQFDPIILPQNISERTRFKFQ